MKEILYLVQATDQEGRGEPETVYASFSEAARDAKKEAKKLDSRFSTTEIVIDAEDVMSKLLSGIDHIQAAVFRRYMERNSS